MELNVTTVGLLSTLVITWGTILVKVAISWFKPNQKQDTAISLLKAQLESYEKNTALLTKTYQNDLHELKGNIKDMDCRLNENTRALSVLTTIIDERLPNKSNGIKS